MQMETDNSWFLHVDLDAFFASVEQLDHPEYRGKPVIVGGKPEDRRSVVSTASYEARKYGVHSAMPTFQAYKLCPNGIYVYGRMHRYSELSYHIMNILKNYSPDVDQMSIDEAFLDITGTEKLFGPPQDTAHKIKKDIKEQTGLTVSIGLARTKYLAKIASDINKPDGFYFVEPGKELELMLNLPLKKIFGLGSKTEETLRKAGIKSTRDIYEKSLETLKFITGENTGQFLYSAVRGQIKNIFDGEVKSHSISSETTFTFDLTDIYTIETTILELSHSLIFRLLKNNGFSKTVMIKIRYEDFSTVSIRQTFDQNILTLDSLYAKAKYLFEKKYTPGRGVRLIGIGLENIENTEHPFQQELFENNNEKKQKVEKAIINLEKKHPEIKVHKARMLEKMNKNLKSLILIPLIFFGLSINQSIYSQDKTTIQNGASGILPDTFSSPQNFKNNTDIKDNTNLFDWNVEGNYKAELSYGFLQTFSNKSESAFSTSLPVFKQEIDLSVEFIFANKWFFTVQLYDDYNQNLYQIKYKGTKTLKDFTFANRNIIFPKEYSVNSTPYAIGGGNNMAPGISFHFEDTDNAKFFSDIVLRYDMTKTSSATFYGKNKLTENKINLNNYSQGRTFYFPDNNVLNNIYEIYIESEKGTYKDKYSRKFKKLSSSEYLIVSTQNILIIADTVQAQKKNSKTPAILITFNNSTDCDNLISSLGNYTNPNSYLGKIHELFNSNYKINISDYTFDLKNKIGAKDCITIQNSNGFSPFSVLNSYDCQLTQNADVYVASKVDNKINDNFSISFEIDETSFLEQNFLKERHSFAKVSKKNITDQSYENPENRYPFAAENPYVYLTNDSTSDFYISQRSYTPVPFLEIGKNVDAASVKVYINGQLDSNAKYESSSGFVTPSKSVSQTDKIYIVFSEDSNQFDMGTINFASGFYYNFSNALKADTSLSLKYPFTPFVKYSTYDNIYNSFVNLTGGLSYKNDNFDIHEVLSFSVENNDATNIYLVNDILTSENQTYYLAGNCGYKTNATPELNGFTQTLLSQNDCTVQNYSGKKDSKITGSKIPLSWDFSDNFSEDAYASVDIKLSSGNELKNSSELNISLQSDSDLSGYEFYLQLGIKAEDDFSGEVTDSIPTYKLDIDTAKIKDWQIIPIQLSDYDRSKLNSNHDARLIVIKKSGNDKGTVYFGPYETLKKGPLCICSDSIFVKSYFSDASKSNAASFINSNINSNAISWKVNDTMLPEDEKTILFSQYFYSTDLFKYKTVNFDFKADNSQNITFILDSDYSDTKSTGTRAIQLTLNKELFDDNYKWYTVCINTEEAKVYLNDTQLSDNYTVYTNKSVIPSRIKVELTSVNESGDFELGNIYLKDSPVLFGGKNYVQAIYKNNKNLQIDLSSTQQADTENSFDFDGFIKLNYTNFGTNFYVDSSFDAKNSGYSISSQKPAFKFLSYNFNYRYNENEKSVSKLDSFSLNFTEKNFPLKIDLSLYSKDNSIQQEQNINGSIDFSKEFEKCKFNVGIETKLSQKKNQISSFDDENLFTGIKDISELEFSFGDESAQNRNTLFASKIKLSFFKDTLSPQMNFSISDEYKNSTQTDNITNTSFIFSVPFKIKNNNFNFSYSKTAGSKSKIQNGGSYSTDIEKLFDTQNSINWYYTQIPFYDLFSSDLKNQIESEHFDYLNFNSKYEFSVKRPLSSFTTAFTRDIKSSQNTVDIYQIKSTLNNRAFNLLAKNNDKSLFKYYKQDEFNSSLTGLYKFSPDDSLTDSSYLISYYLSYLLYKDQTNTLKTGFDFTMSSTTDWQIRTTCIINYDGKNSILVYLPKLFFKKETDQFKVCRSDLINLSFKENSTDIVQTYDIKHNCTVRVNNKFDFTSGLEGIFIHSKNNASSLNILASLGIQIQF